MSSETRPGAARALERETGFEPATPSLEGWRSTAELFPQPRPARGVSLTTSGWWGEEDLNPRRRPPADLQSAPFGHLGISPLVPCDNPTDLVDANPMPAVAAEVSRVTRKLALAEGFEPPTHCLQGSCSAPELRQQSQNFTLISRDASVKRFVGNPPMDYGAEELTELRVVTRCLTTSKHRADAAADTLSD
jgi:hypothetical protein